MTPQQQLRNGKTQFEELILSNGMKLGMRTSTGSGYLLAIELAGSHILLQKAYQAMLCIAMVNGDVQITKNKLQIDALADRLGPEGLDEVSEWFQRKTMPEMFEARELLAAELESMDIDDQLRAIAIKATELRAAKLKNLRETP